MEGPPPPGLGLPALRGPARPAAGLVCVSPRAVALASAFLLTNALLTDFLLPRTVTLTRFPGPGQGTGGVQEGGRSGWIWLYIEFLLKMSLSGVGRGVMLS